MSTEIQACIKCDRTFEVTSDSGFHCVDCRKETDQPVQADEVDRVAAAIWGEMYKNVSWESATREGYPSPAAEHVLRVMESARAAIKAMSPMREISQEWNPPHEWHRYGMGIVRSRLLEDHVYLQGKNGDVWRVCLEMDGLPVIECIA